MGTVRTFNHRSREAGADSFDQEQVARRKKIDEAIVDMVANYAKRIGVAARRGSEAGRKELEESIRQVQWLREGLRASGAIELPGVPPLSEADYDQVIAKLRSLAAALDEDRAPQA